MKKETVTGNSAPEAVEIATLQMEKEALAQQVKRLIKTEGKLYAYQEELDAQLKEYKDLYELNRKLNATFDIGKIFEYVTEYVIYNLEYERVLFFQQFENMGLYAVCAIGGYYDQEEKSAVTELIIAQNDAFLSPLFDGSEYLICKTGSEQKDLAEFRAKLRMNEYLIYPIGSNGSPPALLAVGNSAGNAEFYQRVSDSEEALLGMGNLVGLLSSSIENHIYYTNMEKALEQERLAEAKYRGIFENATEGIYQTTPEGRFISCNPATAAILGYDNPEDVIENITDIRRQLYVTPQRREELYELMQSGSDVKNFEVEFYRKDGSKLWVLLHTRPFFNEKHEIHYIDGIIQDITERKMAEEQLRGSLKEKETLLKEIHHRVKNNLQVISSMLHLQSARATDKEILMAFKESQSRVDTMALIHEKLYQSKDLTVIPMAGYIGDLITNLYISFGINDEQIKAVIKVADVNLNVSTAIPCGLIINELVTNCLKHAFPGGRTGEIVLSLQPQIEGKYELIVSDNGIGFPENADFSNTETLGLKLVISLISQLDGTIELDRAGGSTFTIRFSELLYKERG
ncbi:sensor histidine kinase [Geotalea uraniireducens]|uniref:histidine kinase n=1 Tax=Geotalea uraniireducens (strain Rf4) TaxID=351605 RepID=A5G3D8_GEOUR|nr:histidine kinase dimerization/phosphoacceptor domain -containing protein [Geotalea uraniireducens]ABQ26306.1 signal transduction histidine kinase [Geotalea uraniireducens Rf4]